MTRRHDGGGDLDEEFEEDMATRVIKITTIKRRRKPKMWKEYRYR
jgi:hypothetical protein